MFDLSRYRDRKHLKRRNGNGSGWQFATNKRGFGETKFFGDAKYGGPDAAYEAAIEHREAFLEAARSLGIADQKGVIHNVRPIRTTLSRRNTSGICGVSRYARATRSGKPSRESFWVANHKDKDGQHQQKEFPIHSLGEKAALLEAIRFRRAFVESVATTLEESEYREELHLHCDELNAVAQMVSVLEDRRDIDSFLSEINSTKITATEKQQMITGRIGQLHFRKLVLDYWGNRCAVLNCATMLTASHIKPWSESTDIERLDPFNGIALSPNYDRAFDRGLISFDNAGVVQISESFRDDAGALGVCRGARLRKINELHLPFLDWHRKNIYKKCPDSCGDEKGTGVV